MELPGGGVGRDLASSVVKVGPPRGSRISIGCGSHTSLANRSEIPDWAFRNHLCKGRGRGSVLVETKLPGDRVILEIEPVLGGERTGGGCTVVGF